MILAIDAGTSRVKAGLFVPRGRSVLVASRPLAASRPFEGAFEVSMGDAWRSVAATVRELSDGLPGAARRVAVIGVTGQGDGFWPVTASGEPAGNAVLWNDTRSAEVFPGGVMPATGARCAPLFAGASPCILRWTMANRAEVAERTRWILHCKDWINFRLTGVIATDYSDASTAMLDILDLRYDPFAFDAAGLSGWQVAYPEPMESARVLGTLRPEAAEAMGLSPGIPVIAGCIDVSAAAVGLGAVENGEACTIIGTTVCNEVVIDRRAVEDGMANAAVGAGGEQPAGSVLRHAPQGMYLRVIAALSGTPNIEWARSVIAGGIGRGAAESLAASAAAGSEGVIYVPYLEGERAPVRLPFARAVFFGLSGRHTAAHMMRAVYEGIAFSIRHCYEHLPATAGPVRLAGGGANSDTLCRIVSSCLGRPAIRLGEPEIGLKGIATVCEVALGLRSGWGGEELGENVTEFQPDDRDRQVYDGMYELYKSLCSGFEPFWRVRTGLAQRVDGGDSSD